MDWTPEKQNELENYIESYLRQLNDISKFYTDINWDKVTKLVNVNDIELLTPKVDEAFDHLVMDDNLHLSKFASRWGNKESPLFTDVSQMIKSMGLMPFKEVVQEVPVGADNQQPISEVEVRPKANDMPKLTKTQRRLSLDLMKVRPNLTATEKKGQLVTSAATSITNLNVTTRSKPVLDHTVRHGPTPASRPELRNRRTSLVDEQLPKYIREQLCQGQSLQRITPRSPIQRPLLNNLPAISDTREISRKPSRLQNLVTNSQSLYAHSSDVNSTTNTSEVEHQLRYDTDDDDREYISPGSLAKYYGLQFEEGSDVEYEEEDEEEEYEEEADFVNVGEGGSNDDENDYLFKV
ncbi:hypothetical protein CANMA_001474 [Candida margitis]|uniref:uncharacterized protein n=1 Tax=Candida margitis TaxID=1775924 RepID=UPI00222684CD|nr:uncharacterized protein CANMA_001474 [Candida margitis]KAI5969407.1 hypothetical protein CANMA_001474 [Candida margitis]